MERLARITLFAVCHCNHKHSYKSEIRVRKGNITREIEMRDRLFSWL